MRNKPLFLIWTMIFVLLAGSMKNSLILNFYLLDNQDFTELFCENKEKPAMHCNGNCQLSKMADQENKNEIPAIIQQLKSDLVYYSDTFTFECSAIQTKTKHSFFYLNNYRSAEIILFTPPPVFA